MVVQIEVLQLIQCHKLVLHSKSKKHPRYLLVKIAYSSSCEPHVAGTIGGNYKSCDTNIQVVHKYAT